MKKLIKKAVPSLLVLTMAILAAPMWAADKSSDDQTLRNAATVLQAMLGSKDVPASVVAKADCIIILPSVKKFAVGAGRNRWTRSHELP